MTKNKLLILALLVSISINLLFAGGVAFRVFDGNKQLSGRPLPPNVGWIVRDLDEQRRAELGPHLQASYEEISPLRQRLMRAQRKVNDLMQAEPFDATALRDAFIDLRSTNTRYQELSHEQTSAILALLTDEERVAALEFVKRRGPRDGRDGVRGRSRGSSSNRSRNSNQ